MPTPTAELPRVLGALADDTRWSILVALGESAASASALARRVPVSRQAVAQHLAVLEESGLVSGSRVGREVRYVPVASRLLAVSDELRVVADGWQRRLEAIKRRAEGDAST